MFFLLALAVMAALIISILTGEPWVLFVVLLAILMIVVFNR